MSKALSVSPSDDVNPADDSMLGKSYDSAKGFSRLRAHSLDIQRSSTILNVSKGPLSPELQNNAEEKLLEAEESPPERIRAGRRRSLSCSVPTSHNTKSGCETIFEEPVGEELQSILEGDS